MIARTHRTTIIREVEIDVDLIRDDDGSWVVDFASTDRAPVELTDAEAQLAAQYAAEDSGPDMDNLGDS